MAIDKIDPIFLEQDPGPVRPELLVSAALHLMSHYAAGAQENRACLRLAAVIERHLQALADLPGLEPVLRATCSQLSEQWADLVERRLHPPAPPGLLMRLVAPAR
jgi:hypothetical protein